MPSVPLSDPVTPRFEVGKQYKTRYGSIMLVEKIDNTVASYPWVLCRLICYADGRTPDHVQKQTYSPEGYVKYKMSSGLDLMEEYNG